MQILKTSRAAETAVSSWDLKQICFLVRNFPVVAAATRDVTSDANLSTALSRPDQLAGRLPGLLSWRRRRRGRPATTSAPSQAMTVLRRVSTSTRNLATTVPPTAFSHSQTPIIPDQSSLGPKRSRRGEQLRGRRPRGRVRTSTPPLPPPSCLPPWTTWLTKQPPLSSARRVPCLRLLTPEKAGRLDRRVLFLEGLPQNCKRWEGDRNIDEWGNPSNEQLWTG